MLSVWPEDRLVSVGRIPFAITDVDEAADWLQREVSQSTPVSVRLANAYCVAIAEKDHEYATAMGGRGVNFPDGLPVVWAMRLERKSETRRPKRVRGPSFFELSLQKSSSTGVRNFFLGASDETLSALVSRARELYPNAIISGVFAPPFAPATAEFMQDCTAAVKKVGADIVWVGLGTPKQDFVTTELAERLGIPCVGVGAAFDFLAGTSREAPNWMQCSGLEWIFRLGQEPRRLWRRYLFGNAVFVKIVVLTWLRDRFR